jgi:hypothetical protein
MYTGFSLERFDLRPLSVGFVQTKKNMTRSARTSSQLLRVRCCRHRCCCLCLSADLSAFLSVSSKAVAVRRRLLHEDTSIRYLALSVLDALVHVVWILRDHWGIGDVAFVAARRRDEDVEPARHHEAREEGEEYDMADSEAHDVQRVGLAGERCARVDEVGVGEGVHDSEDGSGDVFH